MEKLTYTKAIASVLNGEALTDEIRDKLEALKASLEKKSSADRKPTAKQTENADIKTAILKGMKPNTQYTITDIGKAIPACADMSNQRISALVRQLMLDNLVKRTEVKRVAYFSLA